MLTVGMLNRAMEFLVQLMFGLECTLTRNGMNILTRMCDMYIRHTLEDIQSILRCIMHHRRMVGIGSHRLELIILKHPFLQGRKLAGRALR